MTVLCAGSFDPITNGHLDIIRRARDLFGSVIVGVGTNNQKQYLFGSQRVELVRAAVADLPGVTVEELDGLLAAFCQQRGIKAVVKGIRFGSDFDFEVQMAHMNQDLAGVETVLLPASKHYLTLSSTILRQVMLLGGDFSAYVPPVVVDAWRTRTP